MLNITDIKREDTGIYSFLLDNKEMLLQIFQDKPGYGVLEYNDVVGGFQKVVDEQLTSQIYSYIDSKRYIV